MVQYCDVGFEDRVNEALRNVRRDLATHSSPPSGFTVKRIGGSLHIDLDGYVYGGDPFFDDGVGSAELLVAVADSLQTLVSNNAGDEVWPICPVHAFGLHPELVGLDAAWVCRPHDHVVALVGELSA
jgi:hypothetical protein